MRINNILNEKLNHIVYVARSTKGLRQAIDNNVLTLKPAFAKGEIEGSYYFIETFPTRAAMKDLIKGRTDRITAIIALNGESLTQKVKPEGTDRFIHDKNLNQNDKLYSSKPSIPGAHSYIEEISVLVPSGIAIPQPILDCKQAADSKGIPFYLYQNETDLLSNNRKNAIVPPSTEPEEEPSEFLRQVRAGKTK